MEFIREEVNEYCDKFTSEELKILSEIERRTNLQVLRPRMLSGKIQGKFLSFIVDMLKPENILEIGTYTAYASIAMAKSLKDNYKLTTIENNIELKYLIDNHIKESKLENKIDLQVGDAKKIIPELNLKFDLAFIDADKENYPDYLKIILPKMNRNGYILADNVLWSGKVAKKISPNDKETKAIHKFNKMVLENPKLENVILPIRDGINIIKVK